LEVLKSLRRESYDVVLMDLHMPEMDGLAATRVINSEWPREHRPRVIAMTASVMMEDHKACEEVGMEDFISKPVRVPELVRALSNSHPIDETVGAAEPSSREAKPPEAAPAEEAAFHESITQSPGVSVKGAKKPDGILDPGALKELREMLGGDDYLEDFINGFLEDAPQMLSDMWEAEKKGDARGLRLAAHSLKSNSAELGAAELSELCRNIEYQAKDGTLDGLVDKLSRAQSEYERVRTALLKMMKK